MNLSKSFIAALVALALAPSLSHAAKLTTTTTQTHVESYTKETSWAPTLSGVYIAGQAGYNDPNGDALNENAVYAGQIGYRFNPNVRVEAEYAYRRNTIDGGAFISGRARVQNTMANVWYDYANKSRFTPYVGGGIGWAHEKAIVNVPLAGFTASDNDNAFVYQLGAGLSYNLCKNIDLTADYRYINTNDFDAGQYIASEVRGGVRYTF